MQSLSEARAGEACTIKWMFGSSQILDFMDQFGIKEGSTINVLQNGKGSMIIGCDDIRLAIGNEIADRIKV